MQLRLAQESTASRAGGNSAGADKVPGDPLSRGDIEIGGSSPTPSRAANPEDSTRRPRASVAGMLSFTPMPRPTNAASAAAPASLLIPPEDLDDAQVARLAARSVGIADLLAEWPGRRAQAGR